MSKEIITGRSFLVWLIDIGIISSLARRVVIDANLDEALTLYVEMYGDTRMIEITPPSELVTDIKAALVVKTEEAETTWLP